MHVVLILCAFFASFAVFVADDCFEDDCTPDNTLYVFLDESNNHSFYIPDNTTAVLSGTLYVKVSTTGGAAQVSGASRDSSRLLLNSASTENYNYNIKIWPFMTCTNNDDSDVAVTQTCNQDLTFILQDLSITTNISQSLENFFYFYTETSTGVVVFDNVQFYDLTYGSTFVNLQANSVDSMNVTWTDVDVDNIEAGGILSVSQLDRGILNGVYVHNCQINFLMIVSIGNNLFLSDLVLDNIALDASSILDLNSITTVQIDGMTFANTGNAESVPMLDAPAFAFQGTALELGNVNILDVQMGFYASFLYMFSAQQSASVLVHNYYIEDTILQWGGLLYLQAMSLVNISNITMRNISLTGYKSVEGAVSPRYLIEIASSDEANNPGCFIDDFTIEQLSIDGPMLKFGCNNLYIDGLIIADSVINDQDADIADLETGAHAGVFRMENVVLDNLYINSSASSRTISFGTDFEVFEVSGLTIRNSGSDFSEAVVSILCTASVSMTFDTITIRNAAGRYAVAVTDCPKSSTSIILNNFFINGEENEISYGLYINVALNLNIDGINVDPGATTMAAVYAYNCVNCIVKNAHLGYSECNEDAIMNWKYNDNPGTEVTIEYQDDDFAIQFLDSDVIEYVLTDARVGIYLENKQTSVDWMQFRFENTTFENNVYTGETSSEDDEEEESGFIYIGSSAGRGSELVIENCEFRNNSNFYALITIAIGANVSVIINNSVFDMNVGGEATQASIDQSRRLLDNSINSFTNGFNIEDSGSSITIYNSTFVGSFGIEDIIIGNDNIICFGCIFDDNSTTTTETPSTTTTNVPDSPKTAETTTSDDSEQSAATGTTESGSDTSSQTSISFFASTASSTASTPDQSATGSSSGSSAASNSIIPGLDENVAWTLIAGLVVALLFLVAVTVLIWKRSKGKKTQQNKNKNKKIIHDNTNNNQAVLELMESTDATTSNLAVAAPESPAVPESSSNRITNTLAVSGEAIQLIGDDDDDQANDVLEGNGADRVAQGMNENEGAEGVDMREAINIFGATNAPANKQNEEIQPRQDRLETGGASGQTEEKFGNVLGNVLAAENAMMDDIMDHMQTQGADEPITQDKPVENEMRSDDMDGLGQETGGGDKDEQFGRDLGDVMVAEDAMMDDIVQHMETKR